jgi:predicted flap endonuclease-1-like 5' DNA nuclease
MEGNQIVGVVITILVILIVLFLIWFLYRRAGAAQEEAVQPVLAAAPVVKAAAPALPDDLTVLEGIGPKVNDLLQKAGITTFAKLAETDPAVISELLQANNLRMLDPRSWPEQARLAAAGNEEGLKALQEKLKGGRAV